MFLSIFRTTPDALRVYRILLMIIVPVSLGVEFLSRIGVIEIISPAFSPIMDLVGLPPELGLAFLTALLVGLWGGIALMFTLVPLETLSVADVTVFSALILFAHALPIEQKIIEQVGPRMMFTSFLRFFGGLVYAFILHQIFSATGWLQDPVVPAWVPLAESVGWAEFLFALFEAMAWMGVILIGLFWLLELLKQTGVLNALMRVIVPILRVCGINGETAPLTTVGLLLGISYGAGPLIKEAQSGLISPRQILLSCILMGFAHSMIEDTILVVAMGADAISVFFGRFAFALIATAFFAAVLKHIPDRWFFSVLYLPNHAKVSGAKAC